LKLAREEDERSDDAEENEQQLEQADGGAGRRDLRVDDAEEFGGRSERPQHDSG
jgi:hypothetical protein